ncbi:NAD(P)/FAD-dependent oxidoreductase [Streptomyces vinaceus]|uniref:hypothetical protein n=1 Tax=Streptomyces vinaceus TaxID=1960 RepID=UPI0036BA0A5F
MAGAGNSAVQIAAELARGSRTTLTTRAPVKFARQHLLGKDLHFWLTRTGLDSAPLGRLLRMPPGQPVQDDGRYRAALAAGSPDRRPAFQRLDGDEATWADGATERLDALILATGYRPDLAYPAGLDGALDASGRPRHRGGACPAHPGPAFVGLECSAACPRTPCAASAGTPSGRPAAWPPTWPERETPATLVRHVST